MFELERPLCYPRQTTKSKPKNKKQNNRFLTANYLTRSNRLLHYTPHLRLLNGQPAWLSTYGTMIVRNRSKTRNQPGGNFMRQFGNRRNFCAIIVLALLLLVTAASASFAQGRGRDRNRGNSDNWNWSRNNRKCGKFVNCHDARNGRWDRRGPRGDRVGNIVWRNRFRQRVRAREYHRLQTRQFRTWRRNR
jgi:hypothetical protein